MVEVAGQSPPAVDPVEQLQRRIADGRISPGERLIEERLATDLGVSRTPIREALITLTAQGYVRRTRRGWHALEFSRAELEDAFELRAILEGIAARHAATRATPEERAHITAAHRATHQAIADSVETGEIDAQRLADENSAFHRAIMAAGHHRWVTSAAESVLVLPLVFNAPLYDTIEDCVRYDHFHGWIAEAIREREPVRAERLMLEHILHARDVVIRNLAPTANKHSEFDHADGDAEHDVETVGERQRQSASTNAI
jgi:DNA-binding GntR family transcriptional regulator